MRGTVVVLPALGLAAIVGVAVPVGAQRHPDARLAVGGRVSDTHPAVTHPAVTHPAVTSRPSPPLALMPTPRARTKPEEPRPRTEAPRAGLSPWWAPALSAVVPGLGQGLLRQQRGVVYLAAEGYLVLRAVGAQRDGRREREAYRDIARTVARAGFPGDRPVADWSYYERLQFVLESGAFNRTPGMGFTPETDPATFNGSIWRLARETFWRDPDVAPDPSSPEYQRALAFYQRRAAGEAFLWSWRDAQLEQDVYRQTIERSNEAFRQGRQMVGLLLANHALSMVDSYVSVRLRLFTPDGGSAIGLGTQLPLPRAGPVR
jgi:hypothetical protein